MSNDMTTLADVQPGGMVRLGDRLVLAKLVGAAGLMLAEIDTCGHEVDPAYRRTLYEAWEEGKAALSAQPSPGGQGDSRSEKAGTFLRQYLTYLRSSPRQGLRPRWCDVYEALEVAIEALAARQPVGEPVGRVRTRVDGGFIAELLPGVADRVSNMAPLYLQQPAQAVDLGTGVKAIAAERERQLQAEGFTRNGDQQYRRGELAKAATAYAQLAAMDLEAGTRNHIAWREPAAVWPWAPEWWKPVDARHDLVRAGALIAAQIDLIDSHAAGGQP